MRKMRLLAMAFVATLTFSQLVASDSLLSKPAFELTEKDKVLLDIIQQEGVNYTPSDLVEINGTYPEAFEKAIESYKRHLGIEPSSIESYAHAIQEAAKELAIRLSPSASFKSPSAIPSPDAGDIVSLLIGINYEGTSSRLSNCILDVEHVLHYLLKDQYNIKPENIILMTDHARGTKLCPTLRNIKNQLTNFVSLVNQSKFGYFHYSGHGSSVKDQSGDELDHMDEALVPIDYNRSGFLIDDDIYSLLVKPLDKDAKLVVTTDCCHSGTILDLPYTWKMDGTYVINHKLSQEELDNLAQVILISGCKDTQTSADGGPITVDNEGSGALTGAFLQVLKNHNYHITYRQLMTELTDLLKKNHFSQRPELSSTYLLDLDDYYMVSPSLINQSEREAKLLATWE